MMWAELGKSAEEGGGARLVGEVGGLGAHWAGMRWREVGGVNRGRHGEQNKTRSEPTNEKRTVRSEVKLQSFPPGKKVCSHPFNLEDVHLSRIRKSPNTLQGS